MISNRSEIYSEIQSNILSLEHSKSSFDIGQPSESRLSDTLNPKLLIALLIQLMGVLGLCCFIRRREKDSSIRTSTSLDS